MPDDVLGWWILLSGSQADDAPFPAEGGQFGPAPGMNTGGQIEGGRMACTVSCAILARHDLQLKNIFFLCFNCRFSNIFHICLTKLTLSVLYRLADNGAQFMPQNEAERSSLLQRFEL
jgi:hypothetical protein